MSTRSKLLAAVGAIVDHGLDGTPTSESELKKSIRGGGVSVCWVLTAGTVSLNVLAIPDGLATSICVRGDALGPKDVLRLANKARDVARLAKRIERIGKDPS